jgi:hypothetical protein
VIFQLKEYGKTISDMLESGGQRVQIRGMHGANKLIFSVSWKKQKAFRGIFNADMCHFGAIIS